jgi:hypothetical protein
MDQLQITLDRRDLDGYQAEVRFSSTEGELETSAFGQQVRFDRAALRAALVQPEEYGRLLSAALFASDPVRDAFVQARAVAREHEVPLRVRLGVGPGAPELHELRWETLLDPLTGAALVTSDDVHFSRYLSGPDWRKVKLRPKADLRALALVANPSDLAEHAPGGAPLAPIDVEGELRRIQGLLGDAVPLTPLAGPGRATLDSLRDHLGDEYDILYVVCHGALIGGEPHLWLEDDAGRACVVEGRELVKRLGEARTRPRLMVLASCQSAGPGEEAASADEGVLAALGPRLAVQGFPAVLAMQGNVSMTTAAAFLEVFFRHLLKDGEIEAAMAKGRHAVRDRLDHWAPTLFLRLKGSCIWYEPGFVTGPSFELWDALVKSIRAGSCTPILGSGLLEPFVGSSRDLARRWAQAHHFPLAPYSSEDLPQVAQYLAVTKGESFLQLALRDEVSQALWARLGREGAPPDEASVEELFREVARQRPPTAAPFAALAELPLPLYITTTPDGLMLDALRAARREPWAGYAPWNDFADWPGPRPQGARPSRAEPLVYHLLGSFAVADSVVVSEDDYFDYLLSVNRKDRMHPEVVNKALTDSALLFLGFQLDDWSFRVLFRSLMAKEGRARLARHKHVAVQIHPEEGRALEPERARRYLEKLFSRSVEVSIYWGSADEFLRDLLRHWRGGAGGGQPQGGAAANQPRVPHFPAAGAGLPAGPGGTKT